jgi:hypothetical protein
VRWAFVILAVLPFQLGLWHHLLASGPSATGFLGYDAPYYAANGREVFERGNGFAHPNPYDPAPAAPVIYFHWLTWVLGFGIKVLHFDPGFFYAALGVVAALLGSALTLRLVEIMLPDHRGHLPLFLLTMWGGGALCLGAMAVNVANQQAPLGDLFLIDSPSGWWFPNWGRNFVLPSESVYHVLVALTWIGVLRERWGLALIGAGALAATHPFSGAQHLGIVAAWLGILVLRHRTMAALSRATAAGLMLVVFLAYYFWFLNLFPEHRKLQSDWGFGWMVSMPFLLLSSGPVAGLAIWRGYAQRWRLSDREWFLLLAGGITLLLMKHEWFIAPRQPIHFSHGYNWLPFWLMALPQLWEAGLKLAARSRALAWAVGAAAGGLIVFDNAAFVVREWRFGEETNQHLDAEQREMFAWMDGAKLDGVLLCVDPRLSYLSATYTSVRPYLGHFANTPDAPRRWRAISAWHSRGEVGPWFDTVDYVLFERRNPPAGFNWQRWRELHANRDYVLLGRAP